MSVDLVLVEHLDQQEDGEGPAPVGHSNVECCSLERKMFCSSLHFGVNKPPGP